MHFCGLTILTDKEYAERIAAAERIQRMLNNVMIEKLLYNAEQYRLVAKGLLGREVRLPHQPHKEDSLRISF